MAGLVRLIAGQILLDEGDAAAAATSLLEALTVWRVVGHDYGRADCLNWLAAAEMTLDRPQRAAERLAEALSIWNRIGGPWGRAANLYRSAQLARRDDPARARALLEQSLALRREIGDRHGEAECLAELAACVAADDADAAELLAEADGIRRAIGLAH